MDISRRTFLATTCGAALVVLSAPTCAYAAIRGIDHLVIMLKEAGTGHTGLSRSGLHGRTRRRAPGGYPQCPRRIRRRFVSGADRLQATERPASLVGRGPGRRLVRRCGRAAQQAGAVRAGIAAPDLIVLLKDMFASLADSADPGLHERVFAVLADGLRPRRPQI